MRFETFIARRYLSSRFKPFFVTLLLFITLFAVSICVFALLFVSSIMNGFEQDLEKRVMGFKAPIVVYNESGRDLSQEVETWKEKDPRIRRVVPFVEGEAVIQSESGSNLGVRVRGISELPEEGRLGKLYQSDTFSEKSILIGQELASSLRVHPDFFEEIRLIFPFGEVGPTGDLLPRIRQLTLTGMFRSGFYEFDSKYVLIPYREAFRLFGPDSRTGLEIWVEPLTAVDEVKKRLETGFSPQEGMKIQTWREENPKLFSALKLEKYGMFLLLLVLLLIASFNIFGLTSLTVMEKIRDMAILRSCGLRRGRVIQIFLLKAAAIGLIGAFVGGGVGLLASLVLQRYPIPLPATYYLETLPIQVDPVEVLIVLLLVPLLTILAALYPAFQAVRRSPVEVLRYE